MGADSPALQNEADRAEWGGQLLRMVAARRHGVGIVASSVALFVVYVALAEASSLFVVPPHVNAVFWLPSGVAFGLFIRARETPALWAGWLLAVFFGELVVVRAHGVPIASSVAFSGASSLVPAVAVLLARRRGADLLAFRRLRDVLVLAALTGASVVPGALIAGASGVLELGAPSFVGMVLSWAISDALGITLLAPVVLTWTSGYPKANRGLIEPVVMLASIAGVLAVVFLRGPTLLDRALPAVVLLLVAWAPIRFGPRTTAVTILLVDIMLVGATANGVGPYARSGLDPYTQYLTLQIVVAAASLLMLLLGAAMEEQRTARASAEAARVDTQRLLDDVRDKEERLRHVNDELSALTQRLHTSKEDERRFIGQELHDGVGQLLTAAKMDLHLAVRQQPPPPIRARIDGAVTMIDQSIDGVRNLSRAVWPSLLEAGLGEALQSLLDEQQCHTEVLLTLCAPAELHRLPTATELALFRITQEALTNVLRHAEATYVEVSVEIAADRFGVTVRDDGKGFDVDATLHNIRTAHLGLVGMRERARSIGAEFSITSAPGQGSRLYVSVPVD